MLKNIFFNKLKIDSGTNEISSKGEYILKYMNNI